jgi:hypothetical protein
VPTGGWLQALQWATLATTVTSGVHYVVMGVRKARGGA